MSKPLKLIFLGSGPIAVPILRALADSADIELTAVVSQMDRPAGRKRVMTPTPLAAAAEEMGLEVIRAADVNAPEFISSLEQLSPDMLCVVSFGQILKSVLLAVPKVCCVNVHASLLPRYRGASPIVQAILNRDDRSGVCFMQMEKGLDSGPVYRTLELPLKGDEYADSLEENLGMLAGRAAAETLVDIAEGNLAAAPQDPSQVTVCRKISKHDGKINWKLPAETVEAMVRAYFPWPGAFASWSTVSGKSSLLTLCSVKCTDNVSLAPGECADHAGKLIVGCGGNSAIEISELIPAGGKRMSAAAFRNGLRGELPIFEAESEI